MTFADDRQRLFEEYLRDGISAVKNGQTRLGESLLHRATYLDASDSRPYFWLSTITTDPLAQIELLEKAVSLDPTNVSARKDLAMLRGMIDESRLVKEGRERDDLPAASQVEPTANSFLCPRCGGRMAFSVPNERLICEYCGYSASEPASELSPAAQSDNRYEDRSKNHRKEVPPSSSGQFEQVLDFFIPTTTAHRWFFPQQPIHCERCGASTLLTSTEHARQCPYCGSNQVLQASPDEDLIEPQLIGIIKVDEAKAYKLARNWLGKGFFAPENLLGSNLSLSLRSSYYSFWTFDGTIEIPWTCEIVEDHSQTTGWTTLRGVETRFFNDVLVPGVKSFPLPRLRSLEPFNLQDLIPFDPAILAGWPAVLYDRSLSDASLLAREKIINLIRPQMPALIEPGRDKRGFNTGSASFSGMTFKHILIPLWVGEYHFQGRQYPLLINGQTGEVAGQKPRDWIKILLALLSVGLVLLAFLLVYLVLTSI